MKITWPEKQLLIWGLKTSIFFGAFLLALGVSLFVTTKQSPHLDFSSFHSVLINFILLLFSLLLGYGTYKIFESYVEELGDNVRSNQMGVEGEKMARPVISEVVGSEYKVYFNKKLPSGGDVDCIIVGPKGIFVVEIKNFSDFKTLPLFPRPNFDDPRTQAKRNAARLRNWLYEHGAIQLSYAQPVVLLINPKVRCFGKRGTHIVFGLNRFRHYFESRPIDQNMTPEVIGEIKMRLEKLA